MVNWGRGVVWRWSMIGLGSMIRLRSVVWLGGVVHYGSVVGLWCGVVRKGGRSVDPNDGLLVASVAVDGLRRSCGLAVDQRVDGAMGFVDRHVHRGRVALQRVFNQNVKLCIFHHHDWELALALIDLIIMGPDSHHYKCNMSDLFERLVMALVGGGNGSAQ